MKRATSRAALLAACCLLLGAQEAVAATVGEAVDVSDDVPCFGTFAVMTLGTTSGTSYEVPGSGTLTSYSTRAYDLGPNGSTVSLVVYRPTAAPLQYEVVG